LNHFLTIDYEEWYHVHYPGLEKSRAPKLINRIDVTTGYLLELLSTTDSQATFFVLGEIAQMHPELIVEIHNAGHEIACHGWGHELIDELTQSELEESIIKARDVLENTVNEKIKGFRAPNFSVSPSNIKKLLDVLEKCDFVYDSSVFSGKLYYGGIKDAPPFEHIFTGYNIIEFPPSAGNFLGINYPLGGFYIRLLPAGIIRKAIYKIEKKNKRANIYIHPKDLDSENPSLPAGPIINWIHNVGCGKSKAKFRELLKSFRFISISEGIAGKVQDAKEEEKTDK